MARLNVDQAYPGISIRPGSRRLWARLMRWPAECIHLENGHHWMATFIPDTLYLRGKARLRRDPARPEVSVCFDCLASLLEPELASCPTRVVAFEPDGENFTQYFFLGREDFAAAGLRSEVAAAILTRLEEIEGECTDCGERAAWLWISRREVSNLDQTERIASSPGALFCAKHGAAKLCEALGQVAEANLFYINAPYGDSGAYVWI
ncbi:MAG TPA: hypothetical protein VGP19_03000 [Candidatus Acidoferrales bacterium]|jgi:hypothetical protein|nr:hypothetical protein [Candidatus Acidoferrales bacterium]